MNRDFLQTMFKRLLNAPKIFRNLSMLVIAEKKINESDYDAALEIIEKIKWEKVYAEAKLMKAKCLIQKGMNKEAVITLQLANVDIENRLKKSDKKDYLNLYCMILIEEASGETIHPPTLSKLYERIDFPKVPERIKRQFPITVSGTVIT
ncbi:tetratricopeptide repeat protein [Labrenzia sp. PHM005]|uniref:tetratricopeptide repeat protein n=1 Tax=Labrenzia sp. PHM005 TaxID=2590016 RepID=UPI00114006FC|nr:tetratricopeptide repeat protein [Labrenzia sp. PHM005]QDG74412.1 tetratricopeptide repeat protein [Labrenzia sp. PHM005]